MTTRNEPLRKRLGELLRQARLEAGLSQLELAILLGLSRPAISTIEMGRQSLSLEQIILLCDTLQLDTIEFLKRAINDD